MVSIFNHTFGYKHDIDGVRQVSENGDECFGHFSAHVEVLVFVLKEVDSVCHFAVGGEMLHNLTIDEEKYFDFVFGEVSIDIFVVELN